MRTFNIFLVLVLFFLAVQAEEGGKKEDPITEQVKNPKGSGETESSPTPAPQSTPTTTDAPEKGASLK
jgi:hypothetical protein